MVALKRRGDLPPYRFLFQAINHRLQSVIVGQSTGRGNEKNRMRLLLADSAGKVLPTEGMPVL